nr:SH3 domain-containing protein [Anaerolineae bacterium]
MAWIDESVKAIDVSVFNVTKANAAAGRLIDFFELKRLNPNIQVVISRLAGANGLDPHFEHNYDQSGEAEFDQGLYLNANPYYSVDYMLNEWWGPGIGNRKPPLIVMDAEVNGWKDKKGKWHDRKSPEEATAHVQEVLAAIRREWPFAFNWIYSKNWWNENIIKGWERKEKFWTSHYPYWEKYEGEEEEWREAWTFEEVDKFLPITARHIPKRAYYVTDEQLDAFQFTSQGRIAPIWINEEEGMPVDLNYIKKEAYERIWGRQSSNEEKPPVIIPGTKTMNFTGKWVYIWNIKNIFRGDINQIITELKRAGTRGVAVKVQDGPSRYPWTEADQASTRRFMNACKANGIRVGLWAYVYLTNAVAEANLSRQLIDELRPDFFLIDAEDHAKGKVASAWVYAKMIKGAATEIGLSSYRFPSLHSDYRDRSGKFWPGLPWEALRSCCTFDSPQVYWRNRDPVEDLRKSKAEFGAMSPKLPFFPAGDLYYEHGIKPTAAAVRRYLDACVADPDITGTLMWSMDQGETTPDLWAAFAEYTWPGDDPLFYPEVDASQAVGDFLDKIEQAVVEKIETYQEALEQGLLAGTLPMPQGCVDTVISMAFVEYLEPILGRRIGWKELARFAGAVKASILNIRTGPGTQHARAGQYRRGDRVDIFEEKNGWGRTDRGWISLDYIQSM